jgi:hypothetical protein
VVHSLGFSAEGSGFESRPRPSDAELYKYWFSWVAFVGFWVYRVSRGCVLLWHFLPLLKKSFLIQSSLTVSLIQISILHNKMLNPSYISLKNLQIVSCEKCCFNFWYFKNAMKICDISKKLANSDNSDLLWNFLNFKGGSPAWFENVFSFDKKIILEKLMGFW